MHAARWSSGVGRFALLGAAVLLCTGANAQFSSPNSTSAATVATTDSSSADSVLATAADESAIPSAPALAASGQYDNKSGNSSSGWKDRLALEFGAGFDPPMSDSSPYINSGYNINLGGGLHVSRAISLLIEYQFIRSGLPSKIIAEAGSDGGNVHLWSVGLAPVINLMPHHNTGVYVTGGGGFYRKVTNFTVQTAQTYCYYFYCGTGYTPQTVGHISSNQGGWNAGGGISHRFGGMYGDGKMAVFAEARYLDVMTPAVDHQSPNGLGATTIGAGTKLVPITFGLRF